MIKGPPLRRGNRIVSFRVLTRRHSTRRSGGHRGENPLPISRPFLLLLLLGPCRSPAFFLQRLSLPVCHSPTSIILSPRSGRPWLCPFYGAIAGKTHMPITEESLTASILFPADTSVFEEPQVLLLQPASCVGAGVFWHGSSECHIPCRASSGAS